MKAKPATIAMENLQTISGQQDIGSGRQKSPDQLSNAKLPSLNRYNVRKLNDSAGNITPDRRSMMSHSASQSLFKRKNSSNLKGSNSQIGINPIMKLRRDDAISQSSVALQVRDKVGFSNRPYVEELISRRNNTKHGHEPSIGGLSKAKSHASLQRIQRMTEERAAAFNSELTLKLSYEWKNVYRSLLQMDVLQKG